MFTQQNFGPIRQGDTFWAGYALEDADGSPLLLVDLTGAVVTWRWSEAAKGPATGSIVTTLDDNAGQAVARLQVPTDDIGVFFYELEMVKSGEVNTMATGKFRVLPDMTP